MATTFVRAKKSVPAYVDYVLYGRGDKRIANDVGGTDCAIDLRCDFDTPEEFAAEHVQLALDYGYSLAHTLWSGGHASWSRTATVKAASCTFISP